MKQFYIKNDALGCFLAPKIDVVDDDEAFACCHTTEPRVAIFFKVLRLSLGVALRARN